MRQHSELVGNRHADSRPAQIDPENSSPKLKVAHCNSSGTCAEQVLDFFRLMAMADQDRVRRPDHD